MHSEPNDIAISVKNLSKTYRLFGHPGDRIKQFFSLGLKQYHREFTALQDVSFDIKKGETVGIIGRNGSGKSTLLQLICGILKPTSGSVQVNGRISALLELGAGFNPEFTGRENVYFQGALMGFTQAQMADRFDEIAAFADIGEFIDQPVRTYSSGMFVRLAFAVAINLDPDILVIDEALAVGDAAFQSRCMEKIHELQSAGVTIVLVAHASSIIAGLCTHAVQINNGTLIQHGAPSQVLASYEEALVKAERQLIKTHGSGGENLLLQNVLLTDGKGLQRSHFRMHEPIIIEMSVVSELLLPNPCLGIEIRSSNGFVLWSTTTLDLGLQLPTITPKLQARIRWKFNADMAPGTYSIAIGAGELTHGHYRRHDRRHHAAEITILDAIGIHGYLPLRPSVEVLDATA